jgi:hypothetical protein
MRFILYAVAVMAAFGDARADNAIDSCVMYERMAGSIMMGRQNGKSASEQLTLYADDDGNMKNTWEWMVLQAYERPVERTPEAGGQAALEFSNWVFIRCLEQFRGR